MRVCVCWNVVLLCAELHAALLQREAAGLAYLHRRRENERRSGHNGLRNPRLVNTNSCNSVSWSIYTSTGAERKYEGHQQVIFYWGESSRCAGLSPAPALGMDGVGTAMGMPIPLLPLFSLLLLPPLLPLRGGERQRVREASP